jgi:hypothetical protein
VARSELEAARPAGVGLEATSTGPRAFNPNTVVVTPERDGFGRDTNVDPLTDGDLAAMHVHMREQIASATAPVRAQVGRWNVIRTELPEVIMANRPPRRGRHYVVLDGTRSIAIDCLWIAEHEAAVSAACERVVAELEREER